MNRWTRIPQVAAVACMFAGALCARDAAAQAAATQPAATHAHGNELRITFERPVVYSGETHLSWMGHVPFAEKRGVTVGALLRVTNVTSTPLYLYGGSRDTLSVGIQVPIDGGWRDLPLVGCATGMKPLALAAGESLELQVPVPAGESTIRINLTYWTSFDPDWANWEKGGSLTASSDTIDVRRWSGRAPAGAASQHAGKQPSASVSVSPPPPASTLTPGVHLAFDRTQVYSGKTHEAWTASYAFVDKRGVTIGALLRLTNATGAPIWVLGFSREALSVGVDVRQRNDWRGLLISEPSADLKPVALGAGESIDVQVPLPDDARNMRVSIRYREVEKPEHDAAGWQTAYSDSIDLRRAKK